MRLIRMTLMVCTIVGTLATTPALAGPGAVYSNTQFTCRPWAKQPEWAKKHKEPKARHGHGKQFANSQEIGQNSAPSTSQAESDVVKRNIASSSDSNSDGLVAGGALKKDVTNSTSEIAK